MTKKGGISNDGRVIGIEAKAKNLQNLGGLIFFAALLFLKS